MPHLPRPGQRVCWRDAWHAHAIRWLYAYGPGPFEVVGVVDKSGQGLPAGVLIKTHLGEKEVSEVWLQHEPADGGQCASPSTTPRTTSGLRVLVVEDDRDTADSYRLLLTLWGHEALIAQEGATAWAMALHHQPHVALLDLEMGGMDGWELARRLRAEPALEGLVLLAISGHGQPADREKSYAAGIDEHLVKPVEPHLICRLLEYYEVRYKQRLALA
jgi:CheY-like chemotaxis protein